MLLDDERLALEALLIDSEDLSRLEVLIGSFNIFEAVGAVQQELRHSDFLAFLLDPAASHGMGTEFLGRFLRRALQGAPTPPPISALDLTVANLEAATVRREWNNIDVLILAEAERLAVVIENKIGSSEHSDQLKRYHSIVSEHFAGWRILGIYLTPNADKSSHESFLPCGYGLVDRVVNEVLDARAANLGEDVQATMQHYSQLLRRHVVPDSEIAILCRQIYQKHQRALDLIFEHRPDAAARVQAALSRIISNEGRVVADHSTKTATRFAAREWDVPAFRQGEGWTPTGRMLLFEFLNDQKGIVLQLIIGPGPSSVREELFRVATEGTPTLRPSSRALNSKWNAIMPSRRVLSAKQVAELSEEELESQLRVFWSSFIGRDLPAIVTAIDPALREIERKSAIAHGMTSGAVRDGGSSV